MTNNYLKYIEEFEEKIFKNWKRDLYKINSLVSHRYQLELLHHKFIKKELQTLRQGVKTTPELLVEIFEKSEKLCIIDINFFTCFTDSQYKYKVPQLIDNYLINFSGKKGHKFTFECLLSHIHTLNKDIYKDLEEIKNLNGF